MRRFMMAAFPHTNSAVWRSFSVGYSVEVP
ncbi:hypothetical protein P3T40_005516 [Paraburkholderia sp. EB58]|jgi:hypothetical protein